MVPIAKMKKASNAECLTGRIKETYNNLKILYENVCVLGKVLNIWDEEYKEYIYSEDEARISNFAIYKNYNAFNSHNKQLFKDNIEAAAVKGIGPNIAFGESLYSIKYTIVCDIKSSKLYVIDNSRGIVIDILENISEGVCEFSLRFSVIVKVKSKDELDLGEIHQNSEYKQDINKIDTCSDYKHSTNINELNIIKYIGCMNDKNEFILMKGINCKNAMQW